MISSAFSKAAYSTQLSLNVALWKLNCYIFSSTPYSHSLGSAHVLWSGNRYLHTHLVLSGFVPAVDFLARISWWNCRFAARLPPDSYYLLFAVFLQLLNSLIVWLLKSVVTAANGKTLGFWFSSLNSDVEQMMSLSQPAGRKQKKMATGGKSEAVLLSCNMPRPPDQFRQDQ